MNCFRKTKDKGVSQKKGKSKDKERIKEKGDGEMIAEDEKDGINMSKTIQISQSQKNALCCGKDTDEKEVKERAKLIQHLQFGSSNGNGFGPKCQPVAYLPVSKDNPFYNMNHPKRGKALILNFDRWENTTIPDLDLSPRLGSEKDKTDLAKCLQDLDFDVQPYDNLGNLEMWNILEDLRKEDHSDEDCLVVAIMTHGERNTLYMRDGTQIPVNLIWEHFEANRCSTMAGKPKIFIVQACRGKKYDSGTKLTRQPILQSNHNDLDEVDSGTFSYVIPNAADIIVAFSCPLGHYSWRNPENGSWFVQSICKVFQKHAYEMDLQGLFTTVAREVAVNYQSKTTNWESHKKKQVTSTSSTLIRFVHFAPKTSTIDSPSVPSDDVTFDAIYEDKTQAPELQTETSQV